MSVLRLLGRNCPASSQGAQPASAANTHPYGALDGEHAVTGWRETARPPPHRVIRHERQAQRAGLCKNNPSQGGDWPGAASIGSITPWGSGRCAGTPTQDGVAAADLQPKQRPVRTNSLPGAKGAEPAWLLSFLCRWRCARRSGKSFWSAFIGLIWPCFQCRWTPMISLLKQWRD